MKKKIIGFILSLTFIFSSFASLSGCFFGSNENEITIVTSYNGPVFAQAARDYMAINPDVTIVSQSIPYDGYYDWLRTKLVTKTAPEVIMLEEPDAFVNLQLLDTFNDKISEVNPYEEDKSVWETNFESPYIDYVRDSNGDLYMIPFSIYGLGLFANKTQYAQAGITSNPETWTEFRDVCQTLKDNGQTPWGVSIKSTDAQTTWPLEMMFKTYFRSLLPEINLLHAEDWVFDPYNPDCIVGEKISYDELYIAFKKGIIDPATSPRIKDAYEKMVGMTPYFNSDYASKDSADVYTDFANAKQTHFLNGTWYLPTLNSFFKDFNKEGNTDKLFEYDILKFPKVTAQESIYVDAGAMNDTVKIRNGFVMPNYINQGKKDIAIDFIKFMTCRVQNQKMFDLINPDTEYNYIGDIPLIKDVAGMEEALKLKPLIQYADLQTVYMYYDSMDKDNFMIDYQKLLTDKMDMQTFLTRRSSSNLSALERCLDLYAGSLDFDWLEAEKAKLQ